MDVKILEERKNPLLKRTEYSFEVAHATAATPSRDQVRGEVAKAVNAPKDRVVIERLHAKFGTATTVGQASAYQSKEAALEISREHILVRNGLKEKAAPASPGAPAPAEAAPAPAKAPAEKPSDEKGAAAKPAAKKEG